MRSPASLSLSLVKSRRHQDNIGLRRQFLRALAHDLFFRHDRKPQLATHREVLLLLDNYLVRTCCKAQCHVRCKGPHQVPVVDHLLAVDEDAVIGAFSGGLERHDVSASRWRRVVAGIAARCLRTGREQLRDEFRIVVHLLPGDARHVNVVYNRRGGSEAR